MKRTKMLALTLVVAIMLAGAGYAAWTDSYSMNTTITTGEFEVVVVGPKEENGGNYNPSYISNVMYKDEKMKTATTGAEVLEADIDKESNTATYTFKNLYPGANARTILRAQNTGTMSAVIQNVKVEVNQKKDGPTGGPELAKAIQSEYNVVLDPDGEKEKLASDNNLTLNQLQESLNTNLRGKVLEPGDVIQLGSEEGDVVSDWFSFNIPVDALVDDQGEKEEIQLSIRFDFVQPNVYDPNLALPELPMQE